MELLVQTSNDFKAKIYKVSGYYIFLMAIQLQIASKPKLQINLHRHYNTDLP